jgi:hypothetical protein
MVTPPWLGHQILVCASGSKLFQDVVDVNEGEALFSFGPKL